LNIRIGEASAAMDDDRTIVGNAEITATDQIRAIFWSSPRTFCFGGAVLVVALIVIGAVGAYGEGMEGTAIFAALFCLLFWPTIVVLSFRRLSKDQRLMSYDIDADRIAIRDATGTAVIVPWKVVRRVVESRSGFAVRLMPTGTRWLPKRAFAADAIPRFRKLVERRMVER
jgi:YcxB-like protein